ncbi:MAG: LamG domain-containing protein [Gemmataceae bacterium]|nr:LamG domain-containing protein [Gemmataceae bacterium]
MIGLLVQIAVLIAEIAMFFYGLSAAITGYFPGRQRASNGMAVRLAGVVMAMALPLGLSVGFGISASNQPGSSAVSMLQKSILGLFIEIGIILGCFFGSVIVAAVFDEKPFAEHDRKKQEKKRRKAERRQRKDREIGSALVVDPPSRDEAKVPVGLIIGISSGVVGLLLLLVIIVVVANSLGAPDLPQAQLPPAQLPPAQLPPGQLPPPIQPMPKNPPAPVVNLPPPKTPPPASDFPGLIAYWPFEDENPGIRVADLSKTGNDGRAIGAQPVDGIRGKALSLNDAVFFNYGAHPSLNFPAGGDFTMACWVKATTPAGMLISHRNSKDDGAAINFFFFQRCLAAHVRQDKGFWHLEINSKTVMNDDRWRHCALLRTGNGYEIFQDGELVARNSGKESLGAITTDLRSVGFEQRWGKKGFLRWPGTLTAAVDEVCIFNRALTPDELRALAGR